MFCEIHRPQYKWLEKNNVNVISDVLKDVKSTVTIKPADCHPRHT